MSSLSLFVILYKIKKYLPHTVWGRQDFGINDEPAFYQSRN